MTHLLKVNAMKQKGAQAVEFALVLPFFILILFALLDFGMLVYNKAIITNASREGARSGVVLSASMNPTTVKQVACDYMRNTLINVGSGTFNSAQKKLDCSGTKDPEIRLYGGAYATCPTPTGTELTPITSAALVTDDAVALTIRYPFSGFSLGSWWSLGTDPSSVGSPLTLTACTQMRHE